MLPSPSTFDVYGMQVHKYVYVIPLLVHTVQKSAMMISMDTCKTKITSALGYGCHTIQFSKGMPPRHPIDA